MGISLVSTKPFLCTFILDGMYYSLHFLTSIISAPPSYLGVHSQCDVGQLSLYMVVEGNAAVDSENATGLKAGNCILLLCAATHLKIVAIVCSGNM